MYFQSLVGRITPMCKHYSTVVAFCEEPDLAAGQVNQALVAAVEGLLHDYRVLICQLENSHRQQVGDNAWLAPEDLFRTEADG